MQQICSQIDIRVVQLQQVQILLKIHPQTEA